MTTNILGDNNRKSRFNPKLADIVNKSVEDRLKKEVRRKPSPVQVVSKPVSVSFLNDDFFLGMPEASSYADGVDKLQEYLENNPNAHPTSATYSSTLYSGVYRPLTFKENILARVIMYNMDWNPNGTKRTEEQKRELFSVYLSSCTGIAYQKGSSTSTFNCSDKFKIIPLCTELINIAKEGNTGLESLPIDYSKLEYDELESSSNLYDRALSLNEVLDHPAWLAAVEGDKALLKEYAEIAFALIYKDKNVNLADVYGMGFYVDQNHPMAELKALRISNLDYTNGNHKDSYVDGNVFLTNFVRLLRVVPRDKGRDLQ